MPALGGDQVSPGVMANNQAAPQMQATSQQPTNPAPTNANNPSQNWYAGPQQAGGFTSPGWQYGFGPSGPMQTGVQNTDVNTQQFTPYQNSGQAGLDTSRIQGAQMPVSSVNPGQQYYQRMEDAVYQQGASRLDPRMREEQSNLETQLQNQGLTRGSAAWNSEMDRQMRARNDAYTSLMNQATMSAGQEAARMQGMDINAGNFANQAAQQNYMNQLSSQNQFNQANQQNWQNQFQAGQQGFQNQIAGQQAFNAATGQQFAQGLAQGNFANQAQQQGFAQDLARANLNNQAYGQQQQIASNDRNADAQRQAAYASAAGQQAIASEQNAMRRQQMEFEQALQMGRYPYELQQLMMQGMYPQGNPQMPNVTTPGYNSPNNYYNAGMASNQQQGQQNSLGGNLIGQGINLIGGMMGWGR